MGPVGGLVRLAVVAVVGAFVLAACQVPSPPQMISGPIAAPPGCPQLPDRIAAMELGDRHPGTGGVAAARESTAIDVWGRRATHAVDARTVAEFFARFHDEHPIQAEGKLPTLGIDVEVRSDAPITVDLDALDELTELMLSIAYPDPRFAVLIECYRNRMLVGEELRDTTLRIYIPSDPSACFQSGVIRPRGLGGCDAVGAAVPEVRVGPRFLGMRPGGMTWPSTIFITPGQHFTHIDRVEERAARITVHELMHFFDNTMGLYPHPIALREYEQRAYYAERVIRDAHTRGQVELPTPFEWHRRMLPETADDERT